MAGLGQQRDSTDSANTVAALGLRRAALRGMLASPIIDADDQKGLRDELVNELRSIALSISRAPSKNAVELCAKLDVLGEEYRPDGDSGTIRELIASVRRDVVSLTARPAVQERSSFQTIRPLHNQRATDAHAASADADKHDGD
ncbi:hypothetical protein [Labrys monachus]|uniref:Uncharacterized protein n=1 Tax=Labrys monachus TaxID=217067 RepID=A0ABU0FGY0_9HYPH|nr:hypothetical protein [Labrys monachus]MDQ0393868.1 hypothetical protein [Labrys monachus]